MRKFKRNSMKKIVILSAAFAFCAASIASAQTDCSLFFKKDGVQLSEISVSQNGSYKTVGHHGPAVENLQMALRLYFNDSGAIDVYSKKKDALELAKYRWYPSEEQQKEEGAGVDEYYVGKTFGLGGIAIVDNGKLVRPVAKSGRSARVGKTADGSFAELTSYGIELSDGPVDLTLRIDVRDGERWATVTASASRKVRFATGVNLPDGAQVNIGRNEIAVWGTHPADVSRNPLPIGAALRFKPCLFSRPVKERNQVRIDSGRRKSIRTKVLSASAAQVLASQGGSTAENWMKYLKNL